MNDLLGGDGPGSYRNLAQEQFEDQDRDMEASLEEAAQDDPHMRRFFNDIEDVKNDMEAMRRKLGSIQEANEESKKVTRATQMKALKQRMDGEVNSILRTAKGIKDKIINLQRENMLSRRRPGCEENSNTDRTRASITQTQMSRLRDLMDEFTNLRNKVNADYKQTVERRFYTVTGERPDPELVDQLISTGDGERIFERAIQEQGRGQLVEAIAEIQERSDAVHDLERQLQELHSIFMDMATLVESQGELLDNIEEQVVTTKEHVASGTKQLAEARKTQLNTRKWMICGIMTAIIVIILVVIFVLKPWELAT